ncbi:30S ribosomal protein S14 [Candidatus Woesearchaeota archaeon]|nr:30S ribosomal protein S14 [Candidatus Woesearchaeota archaeon]MBT4835212.1 30S ribosomal protein S14 [Candidatus Woesearchaeota archaeon]MBT6734913.1 30S ribosomal protein S14 [Candidatus Woesearchaeota archaeon]MBT7169572.1 30S ribosomal protein S14 [Candidatus Woesearchaeota archaeon]MBT7474530.1 30S ribosomal protein S14 [Candidatus Woesearchaeota archaeon]
MMNKMTAADYKKAYVQLKAKPVKLAKFIKHNKPKDRSCGIALKKCKMCGRNGGHIQKYGLSLCRQCFRETAKKLGFKKYN